MIKIIKHGTRDIRECNACGCLFSFDNEDKKFKFRGGSSEYSYVICPQCCSKVVLVAARQLEKVNEENEENEED